MDNRVRTLLKRRVWSVATHGIRLNVVPVGLKAVLPDGRLAIGDVFMELTVENVKQTGEIVISAYDGRTLESYLIRGEASYEEEGEACELLRTMAEGKEHIKGAIVVVPGQIIDLSPGEHNGRMV